jgi:hypothetical protein
MGYYRTRFLLHQFSLKSNITVHRSIITPVYNEFYTPVPVCRDPVLAMKISIFVKTSLKPSFSFQTLLRVIFVRASLLLLCLANGTSGRRPKSQRVAFLMGEYRTCFLLLLADIDQSKKLPPSPDALKSMHKALHFRVQSVSTLCDILYIEASNREI